jgi:hypothetical protein
MMGFLAVLARFPMVVFSRFLARFSGLGFLIELAHSLMRYASFQDTLRNTEHGPEDLLSLSMQHKGL